MVAAGGHFKANLVEHIGIAPLGLIQGLFSSLCPCMGQRINLHCCVVVSETFYKGDKSDMKTLFNFVLSHFTKSGSNPLSVVAGNLGNEVLRKWMKAP